MMAAMHSNAYWGTSRPRRRHATVATVVAASLIGTLLLSGCGDDADTRAATTTSTRNARRTTTTPGTGTTTSAGMAVILAPPGRLPMKDVTSTITARFPTPITAEDPLTMSNETIKQLRSNFEADGYSANLSGVSNVGIERKGRPLGSVVAAVFEVRNQEASGDDTTAGYDLVFTYERDDSGTWRITKVEEQRICSRGISSSSGEWLCV